MNDPLLHMVTIDGLNCVCRFVRYGTIEEAKTAAKALNNSLISNDGNKLIVRPAINKQHKIGHPVLINRNDMSSKKQPVVTKSVTTKAVTKVTHETSHHPNDDDDDVWDDGLLPKSSCYNGRHDNKGIKNGMAALDVNDKDVSLREMFVSEVSACVLCHLL